MRRTKTKAWDMRGINNNNNSRDRISELPDPILTHILSFLETKYAVQTSSLSKRWTSLWTSLTSLSFHDCIFRKLSTFEDFVEHVLTHRDNSIGIDKFVFVCNRATSSNFYEKVASYATANGVKHLEVCTESSRFFSIPNSVFSAASLKTLKLKATRNISTETNTQFCFQQLELLHLEGFRFKGSDDLFSKCPNLVELSIVDCKLSYSDKPIIISAPQLTRLNISLNFWCSLRLEFVLSLPKLTSFSFKATTPVVLQTDELPLLKTLRIDLDCFNPSYEIERQKKLCQDVVDMLQKLHNAQHVSLSVPTVELLYVIAGTFEISPVQFVNLKTLTMINPEEHKFDIRKHSSKLIEPHKRIYLNVFNQVLNYILQNSPHAELVMELPRCKHCKD